MTFFILNYNGNSDHLYGNAIKLCIQVGKKKVILNKYFHLLYWPKTNSCHHLILHVVTYFIAMARNGSCRVLVVEQFLIIIIFGSGNRTMALTVCRLSCRKIEVDDPAALVFFLWNNFRTIFWITLHNFDKTVHAVFQILDKIHL